MSGRARKFKDLGHFESHFVFDDLTQRDICHPKIDGIGHHRVASAAVARIELAHTAGNHIYQDIGIPDFFEGLFDKFSGHLFVFWSSGRTQKNSDRAVRLSNGLFEVASRAAIFPEERLGRQYLEKVMTIPLNYRSFLNRGNKDADF